MKRAIVVVALAGLLALAGCAQAQNSASSTAGGSSSPSASSSQAEVGSGSSATGASPAVSPAVATSAESEEAVIVITAGDASFEMTPADTDAARELVGKLQDGPVTVSLHAYGGFEHVDRFRGPCPRMTNRSPPFPVTSCSTKATRSRYSTVRTAGLTRRSATSRAPQPTRCSRLSATATRTSRCR
ncbi:MAG: cyclophilin-like fold protein [Ellagibacter isourolithinifaciens]|nr:hypothetical protein [Ellagibacter isourolithinifaciens]MEE0045148.1 cyclophilin-like fold protein [Ellagibacter isourolithinifaciens]